MKPGNLFVHKVPIPGDEDFQYLAFGRGFFV